MAKQLEECYKYIYYMCFLFDILPNFLFFYFDKRKKQFDKLNLTNA